MTSTAIRRKNGDDYVDDYESQKLSRVLSE
jgi:hypothetical protein